LSSVYERCMPTIQYFVWDPHVRKARETGWTVQERSFHSYFRVKNIMFQAYNQSLHPWSYYDRQRKDQFTRRVETLLPGYEVPDWAQDTKKMPDVDLDSLMMQFEANRIVEQESTPKPHYNFNSLYFAPQNWTIQRNNFGFYAQRLFYNENIRGDYYKFGYSNKEDTDIMNSWYSNSKNNDLLSEEAMTREQLDEKRSQVNKWVNNVYTFYPEYKNTKIRNMHHKIDEPYFERNMDNIRDAAFASIWIKALKENAFTQEEVDQIHEVFLNKNDEHFFEYNEELKTYLPTKLYNKFVDIMNFADVFELDKFTGYIPEHQFLDKLDSYWNINYYTVDAYRSKYHGMIEESNVADILNNEAFVENNGTHLVSEEIYNPQFREILSNKFRNLNLNENQSYVMHAVSQNLTDLANLNELAQQARDSIHITSRTVRNDYINNSVRKIVSTFTFIPNAEKTKI